MFFSRILNLQILCLTLSTFFLILLYSNSLLCFFSLFPSSFSFLLSFFVLHNKPSSTRLKNNIQLIRRATQRHPNPFIHTWSCCPSLIFTIAVGVKLYTTKTNQSKAFIFFGCMYSNLEYLCNNLENAYNLSIQSIIHQIYITIKFLYTTQWLKISWKCIKLCLQSRLI